MSNVRYRHIVRDYERRFIHQVRLPHCRLWRMGYVDGQLDHLEFQKDVAHWSVGSESRGDFVGVYGFKCPVHAAILQDWSTRCDIDWSIPPEEQTVWPPRPPRPHRKVPWQGPARANPNLHGLAGSGRPLGATCKACNHRALVPLDRIGAHSGNMQEVRTLKLKCGACQSREWRPTIFQRDEDVAAFLQPTASTPAF